jgi:Na+/H+ antiporter NhaD/arsenite permease-like protein
VWRFDGLINLLFLGVVLGAVFINHPAFVRELLMLAAAAASYFITRKEVHESNDFNFLPIKEVAVLFAAIFATMMPALDWLQANAAHLFAPTTTMFFWGSGTLSSVLDNAPTYLSFLSAACGAFAPPDSVAAIVSYLKTHGADLSAAAAPYSQQLGQTLPVLQRYYPKELLAGSVTADHVQVALLLANPLYAKCLKAISIGSVFFGANTYIGNGPNFMVKAIADQQKAHTPTFVGYVFRFTLPFMLPMLLIVWWLFFRA